MAVRALAPSGRICYPPADAAGKCFAAQLFFGINVSLTGARYRAPCGFNRA